MPIKRAEAEVPPQTACHTKSSQVRCLIFSILLLHRLTIQLHQKLNFCWRLFLQYILFPCFSVPLSDQRLKYRFSRKKIVKCSFSDYSDLRKTQAEKLFTEFYSPFLKTPPSEYPEPLRNSKLRGLAPSSRSIWQLLHLKKKTSPPWFHQPAACKASQAKQAFSA